MLKSVERIRYLNWARLSQLVRFTHINHPGHKKKPLATAIKPRLPDNYLDEPNYPPIKPKYPPGEFSSDYDIKKAWNYFEEGQKFHALRTIQERLTVLAYLNVQATLDDLGTRDTRYYPIYKLSAIPKAANSLKFYEYITNTSAKIETNLPNQQIAPISDSLYDKIKNNVKNMILANFVHKQRIEEEPQIPIHPDSYVPEVLEKEKKLNSILENSDLFIKDILNTISSNLATTGQNDHLVNAQYATNVDIKSYWKRCGFKKQKPRGAVFPDTDTIRFQFEDVASYQIKCNMPLKPTYKIDDPNCKKGTKIEKYAFNPSNFKIFGDHILPMQVPGHWYGDSREFNFITVFNTTKMFDYLRSKYENHNGDEDALKSMAITAGHAELTAQAYYLGFSMWKDLTYPLMGQYLFTNGQDFAIGTYQLNTLRLWNNCSAKNNLCFLTKPQRLFELSEDYKELKSFNDDLFRKILSVFMNKPVTTDNEIVENYSELDHMLGGTALRPYLSIQDFEKQLSTRQQLFAITLYEIVKYDRPANYLNLRDNTKSHFSKPRFQQQYDRWTYEFRDLVLDYYPRDYHGFQLIQRSLKEAPKQTEKFWDLKHPVYEWANVPPPDTNNIPRKIDLAKF